MKQMAFAVALALLFVSQSAAQMPMGGQSGSQSGSAQPGGTAPGGMMGGMMPGMMGGGMMCPMMGGMGMMAMMGGGQDPKATGRMLQMRADMMRAMADVMAKYGKAMEEGK